MTTFTRRLAAIAALTAAPALIALGAASALALWRPTPGTHVVALVDAAETTLASATVEVRGARR